MIFNNFPVFIFCVLLSLSRGDLYRKVMNIDRSDASSGFPLKALLSVPETGDLYAITFSPPCAIEQSQKEARMTNVVLLVLASFFDRTSAQSLTSFARF